MAVVVTSFTFRAPANRRAWGAAEGEGQKAGWQAEGIEGRQDGMDKRRLAARCRSGTATESETARMAS